VGNLVYFPIARKFWIKPSVAFWRTIIEQEGIGNCYNHRANPISISSLFGLNLKNEAK